MSENKQLSIDISDLEKSYDVADEELTEIKSTNSDLECRLTSLQKQNEVLKMIKSENETEMDKFRKGLYKISISIIKTVLLTGMGAGRVPGPETRKILK